MFKSKKAYDIPFSLIFSLVAGAFIIFIAIYASTSLIKNSTTVSYTQNAQAVANYLNPVVTGLASSLNPEPINFNKETRIYLSCNKPSTKSYFGSQSLSFSEESGFIKKWQEPELEIIRNNKYIFAEKIIRGKRLFIIALPVYTGFKVDDLVILSFNNYCFIDTPELLGEDIDSINSNYNNLNLSSNINSCPKNSIKVCFGNSANLQNCNISVYGECSSSECKSEYDYGYTLKNNKRVYYFENLLYASIFSDPEIYECNVKRLSNKIIELSSVYSQKIDIVRLKNQNSNLQPYLNQINDLAKTCNKSQDLVNIYLISKDMDEIAYQESSEIYFPDSKQI